MNFADIRREVEGGTIRPLYIFVGPEREAMQRAIQLISGGKVLRGTFADIVPRLTSRGLFGGRMCYLIEGDRAVLEHDIEDILRLVGNHTLILVFETIDGRSKFFRDAEEHIVRFERFTEVQLVASIKKRVDVDDRLATVIARACGMDMARIDNECHKLKHLGRKITLQDLEELLVPELDDRIFDMVDLIAKKRIREAYTIYRDLLALKESPLKIISLLYPKFKQVFLVYSMRGRAFREIMEKTGLNYYQVQSAVEAQGAHTLEGLLRIMRLIQQAEVDFKTGKMDPYVGMDHLFYEIARA